MYQSQKSEIAAILLLLVSMVTANQCPVHCDCGDPWLVSCHSIDRFPNASEIPPNTIELMLHGCDISMIEKVPNYGSNFSQLMIINSNVRQIADNAFSELTALRVLYLNGNQIKTITKDIFNGLNKLEELNLGNNLITKVPDKFLQSFPSLIRLDLNSNKNISLGQYVFESSALQQLSLEHCGLNISVLPILQQATALTYLDLDHNVLGKVPGGILESLSNLKDLFIANCSIKEIDKHAFDGLVKLETLDLSFNQLSILQEDVVHDIHGSLKKLLLHHNNLTGLSYKFSTYQYLGLEGNPWHCDCSLKWMQDIDFPNGDNVTCFTPEGVKGQHIHNVTSSMHFCPCGYEGCEEKGKIAVYIIIPILIVCSILIGYYIFKMLRNRKLRAQRTSVRYSSVYKDTVEYSEDKVPLHK